MRAKFGFLAAVLAAAALTGGCQGPTHSILTDLPSPGPALGSPPPLSPAVRAVPTSPAIRPPAPPAAAPSHRWVPKAVAEVKWRYIVIHHSATERGCAATFDKMHRVVRGWDELGYHFVITNGKGGADGVVEVGPRWRKQKWGAHCGGTPDNEYNEYGIGICLVGKFDARLPSQKQLLT